MPPAGHHRNLRGLFEGATASRRDRRPHPQEPRNTCDRHRPHHGRPRNGRRYLGGTGRTRADAVAQYTSSNPIQAQVTAAGGRRRLAALSEAGNLALFSGCGSLWAGTLRDFVAVRLGCNGLHRVERIAFARARREHARSIARIPPSSLCRPRPRSALRGGIVRMHNASAPPVGLSLRIEFDRRGCRRLRADGSARYAVDRRSRRRILSVAPRLRRLCCVEASFGQRTGRR